MTEGFFQKLGGLDALQEKLSTQSKNYLYDLSY